MDRLYSNRDQYGNIIGTEDDSNTNTLLTPVGLGASQITRDDTLFNNPAYDGDRLELDDLLQYFPLLKSPQKLMEQDQVWKKFCKYLKWEFYPTFR